MRIHYFQHVPFEGLGSIQDWVEAKGHTLTATRFYEDAPLPEIRDIDWLIIMGGPMSTYDENKHAWLRKEKQFIEQAIACKKTVLGVCLGAQLISDVLGAKVYPNRHKEIGWFPIRLTQQGLESPIFEKFPREFDALHWHGDTFDLPADAIWAAESAACQNQAFIYGKNVVGLQFHLDFKKETLERLIENCSEDLVDAPYVQDAAAMLSQEKHFEESNKKMNRILNALEKA